LTYGASSSATDEDIFINTTIDPTVEIEESDEETPGIILDFDSSRDFD